MKVLAATPDGMWEIHEVRDESLLDTHTSVSWTLVHLPSGDATRSFGWTESREGGSVTRSGDREIRFAPDGGHVEVTREDGRVEKLPLEWPVPPANTPADAQMPEGWATYEKRLQEEYQEKLRMKERLEAIWRQARK